MDQRDEQADRGQANGHTPIWRVSEVKVEGGPNDRRLDVRIYPPALPDLYAQAGTMALPRVTAAVREAMPQRESFEALLTLRRLADANPHTAPLLAGTLREARDRAERDLAHLTQQAITD